MLPHPRTFKILTQNRPAISAQANSLATSLDPPGSAATDALKPITFGFYYIQGRQKNHSFTLFVYNIQSAFTMEFRKKKKNYLLYVFAFENDGSFLSDDARQHTFVEVLTSKLEPGNEQFYGSMGGKFHGAAFHYH